MNLKHVNFLNKIQKTQRKTSTAGHFVWNTVIYFGYFIFTLSVYIKRKLKRNHVDLGKQYLAFVMLFLAATSLAVRGSGSDVGMGEFWKESRRIVFRRK